MNDLESQESINSSSSRVWHMFLGDHWAELLPCVIEQFVIIHYLILAEMIQTFFAKELLSLVRCDVAHEAAEVLDPSIVPAPV